MSNNILPLFPELEEQISPASINHAGMEPIWTQHKADFIARYLKSFTWVTKHGCYIDGFAGPRLEEREGESSWAAELVLNNRPAWLRQIHLCDADPKQLLELEKLISGQPDIRNRTIRLHKGDFNELVDDVLNSGDIKPKTATFALLDQFTCECHWQTVQKLARHKPSNERKIELQYFVATGWLHRSLSRNKSDVPDQWWGNPDWRGLLTGSGDLMAVRMTERFRDELGYRFSNAYQIFSRPKGKGRVMFHLIHATDHELAPSLMRGAYRQVIRPPEEEEQYDLALETMFGNPDI